MKNFKDFMGSKKDKDKDNKSAKDVKTTTQNPVAHKDIKDTKAVKPTNTANLVSQNANTGGDQEPANLTIHSIFVKDISYEAPSTPQVFSLPWEPQVKFDIQVMRRVIDQAVGVHEVILHTTISTKLKTKKTDGAKSTEAEDMTAFLIDIKLAGVFTIKGLQEAQLDRVLSTTAPTILFPYAAEAVASLVTRGGFPQFILPPIDFSTLYQQRLNQQANDKTGGKRPQTNQDGSRVS